MHPGAHHWGLHSTSCEHGKAIARRTSCATSTRQAMGKVVDVVIATAKLNLVVPVTPLQINENNCLHFRFFQLRLPRSCPGRSQPSSPCDSSRPLFPWLLQRGWHGATMVSVHWS